MGTVSIWHWIILLFLYAPILWGLLSSRSHGGAESGPNTTGNASEGTLAAYRGTRVMNIVGATGWAVGLIFVAIVLLVKKDGVSAGTAIVPLAALYGWVIGVPAFTAHSLSSAASTGLRRGMLWANYFLIGIVSLGVVGSIVLTPRSAQSLVSSAIGILLFLPPALINVRALRTLTKSRHQPYSEQH